MRKNLSYILLFFCCTCLFFSACSGNVADSTPSAPTTVQESLDLTEGTSDAGLHSYDEILNNIINAYPWNDDDEAVVPENPELSYMYRRNSELSEIGFALIDLDHNGQEELIISGINVPIIYDLYTIADGTVTHLFDSAERNFYLLYENGFIENGWSASAATSGHDFYKLNDGELVFIERITLDAYHALDAGLIGSLSEANADNSYFKSKSEKEADYALITSDEALKAIEAYQDANDPLHIEYTLLSEYKK